MRRFTDETLAEIWRYLSDRRQLAEPSAILELEAADPDTGAGRYPGEAHETPAGTVRHRSYRCWVDIAELLGCRMLTPIPQDRGFVRLRFQALVPPDQPRAVEPHTEKYGLTSDFFRVQKLEQPHFYVDYRWALSRVPLRAGMRILSLGVHRGDELVPLVNDDRPMDIVGIDHCASALDVARDRFPSSRVQLIEADLRKWESMHLERDGRFDLIISIGTLHSPAIGGKNLFPALIRALLAPEGSVILGFPNVRYIDGEQRYGAQLRNFSEPELSLFVKDLIFYRRLLNNRRLHVTVTGKYYGFVTGVPPGSTRTRKDRTSSPRI
ncbi:MAG: class I SAM-dependent methyltransferase [Nannocystaceae bacterium]